MRVALFLGADVGTTSVSAVLLATDARRVIAAHSVPHDARRAGTRPGRAELDLEALWHAVLAALEMVVGAAGATSVAGIGVTGQMHGLALLRPDGMPLAPAITWQDQRACERDEVGDTYLARYVREAGGPEAFARTGGVPATGYLGPSLYWLSREGLLPTSPAVACLIPDAIVARLTGGPPVTDPSDAASTGLFDVVSGAWDQGLIARLGLPASLLAPVRPSGEVAGGLRDDVARRLGLAAGTPVAVAIGDNQASYIGSVRAASRGLLINIGTGAQISAWSERFVRARGLEARPFPGAGYLLVGAGLYGGESYALLRDLFRRVGRAFFGARGDEALYDAMNRLAAEAPPGSDGLRCVPLFSGTRDDAAVRGAFEGVSGENLTPGHLARAVLEGVAEQLHALSVAVTTQSGPRPEVVGAGNAIARNPLLARILAMLFGAALRLPAFEEPAAVGAALLAATAVGAYPDVVAAMDGFVRYAGTVAPEEPG